MSSALFNTVPTIEILYDSQNQSWIHRAKYGRYLGLDQINNSIPEDMKQQEMCTRAQLLGRVEGYNPIISLGKSKKST